MSEEMNRIIKNIKSVYGCFENDRCCSDADFEDTEKELDEIISFINNLDKQLQTAKEENEKLKNLLGKPYKRRIDLENNNLAQQNKQMRENINNIKNLCNEDWEDMTVDKFQNQLLQALKEVNNEK